MNSDGAFCDSEGTGNLAGGPAARPAQVRDTVLRRRHDLHLLPDLLYSDRAQRQGGWVAVHCLRCQLTVQANGSSSIRFSARQRSTALCTSTLNSHRRRSSFPREPTVSQFSMCAGGPAHLLAVKHTRPSADNRDDETLPPADVGGERIQPGPCLVDVQGGHVQSSEQAPDPFSPDPSLRFGATRHPVSSPVPRREPEGALPPSRLS